MMVMMMIIFRPSVADDDDYFANGRDGFLVVCTGPISLLRNVKIQYFEISDLIFISFLLIYGQEQFRFDYLFWIISMYWQQQLPNWLIE